MIFSKNFIIPLFLFFSVSVVAQKPPPGTVRLKPSKTEKYATFIDKNMITLQDWVDYLWWLGREKDTVKFKAMLPDGLHNLQIYSMDWEKNIDYIDTLGILKWRWRYPAFRDYPLIGISYEQVIEYCAWRTDRVNELLKLRKKKYTVVYTLPTEEDCGRGYFLLERSSCSEIFRELTAEKTVMIKKGHRIEYQPYQGAEVNLGFRCVAEIHQ